MKKAIIVWGGWDGHEPEQVAAIFKELLEKEDFEVTVSHTLESFKSLEYLREFDLIVPIWTQDREIDEAWITNVCNAVEEGVGLAGCHGGMCDSFRNSTRWQFLTGAQWVAHPGNDGTEYMVNICKSADSPLVEGIEDFKVISEQYYIHIDPAVHVLATTTFPTVDGPHAANGVVQVPVVFTKKWGRGRVFYSSLGHHADIFDIPEALEMMRRGFVWAAK